MNTYIILLRGVMPTGKNKVLMAPLREVLSGVGLKEVRTYIQSGNIIARSYLPSVELEKLVHEVISKVFGGDIAVLVRTLDQFSEILELNPFKEEDGKMIYFSLLTTEPDKKLLKNFLSTDFSPNKVRYIENTIYAVHATKYSDSKFNNNYFERNLKVTATTRNHNTMTRLIAMANG